ncbi:HAMP domain-containing histidine kinase [Aestuariibacter halophilus]|uniref:histidine kinase n=1 Tax=Fluctibacter halophilus TaxID=226011 RepID=A0ABS8G6S5_9ALTE|nr:HAMP domain-containing sensor histidine kinase [Aestuariibacter halophilus]MCC2616240.1 HAMP domain-containing histidine kinase [Aestuariibacter halophilus]
MQTGISIRALVRRLVVTFSVILSVAFIVVLQGYAWVVEDNVFNRLVADEATFIEHTYQQQGSVAQPRLPFMRLYASWDQLPDKVQQMHQASPSRIEFPLSDEETLHVRTLQLDDKRWILAANIARYEVSRDYLPRLLPWFAAIVGLVALAALWVAHYLSKTLVVPLAGISRQVREHQGDQALQLQHDRTVVEINYLSDVITSHYNELQQAFDRESRFTRDVSHELRTPITVLKMLHQKLANLDGVPADELEKHRQAVEQLQHNLHGLLALARAESLHAESVLLVAEIEHEIVNHATLSTDDTFRIELDVAPDYRVSCNRNLLRILLANVLDNAVHHAAQKALVITLRDDTLTFTNPVDSLPVGDVLAPSIKSDKSTGLGQGLFLLERICEQFDWGVQVSHQEKTFSLHIHFTNP